VGMSQLDCISSTLWSITTCFLYIHTLACMVKVVCLPIVCH
jgi:hypothetical protein